MLALHDALVMIGLGSVALMWTACAAAALHVVWDTVGEHIEALVDRMKRKE